jgi:hypothetical protein
MSILVTFLILVLPSSTYVTRDIVHCGRIEEIDSKKIVTRASLPSMDGWPNTIATHTNYSPCGATMADLDGDGVMEIMAGSTNGEFKLWDINGDSIWIKSGLGMIQSKPAVGDIDLDGMKEIVITNRANTIYIWESNGSNYPGWPITVGEISGLKSPVLFDLNGDDTLEIIVGERDYPDGKIGVYNHDGTLIWSNPLDYMCVATPSVGDIDNDSVFEIVAASYYSLYAWDANGNTEPGWPLNIVPAGGMSYSQPTLVDLDNDGYLEIAITYYDWNTYDDYLGVWNYDGTAFTGWPQTLGGSQSYNTPVTVDVDRDSIIELCDASSHYVDGPLHLFSSSGTEEPGWPFYFSGFLEGTPVAFDFDGDQEIELLVANNSTPGEIYVLNPDASQVPGAPFDVQGTFMVNGSTVGDADGDGDVEICLLVTSGTTAYINLYTLDSIPYRGYRAPYFSWFHDLWNTGWLHPQKPEGLTLSSTGDSVTVEWNKNSEPDIRGYFIYRNSVSGEPYHKLNPTPCPDTFYIDTTVTSGETYYYTVSAVVKSGAESYLSLEDTITVPTGIYEIETLEVNPRLFCPTFNRGTICIEYSNLNNKQINTIAIIDVSGRKVKQWRVAEKSGTLRTNLPYGIYFIRTNRGCSTRKVIVL